MMIYFNKVNTLRIRLKEKQINRMKRVFSYVNLFCKLKGVTRWILIWKYLHRLNDNSLFTRGINKYRSTLGHQKTHVSHPSGLTRTKRA